MINEEMLNECKEWIELLREYMLDKGNTDGAEYLQDFLEKINETKREFINEENKELLDEYFRINKEINKKLKTYKKILSDCYNSIVFEIEHIYEKESLFLTNEENFKLQEERTIFLKKLLFMIIDILEEKNND